MNPDETVITNAISAEELDRMIQQGIKRHANTTRNRPGSLRPQLVTGGLTKAFEDDEPDKQQRLERAFQWLRALYRNDGAELKVLNPMNEGTGSAGGYTAPTEFAADIFTYIGEYGAARRYAFSYPMHGSATIIPKVTGSPSVAVTSEAGVIAASKATIGQETLTPVKLAGITAVSNELLADANIGTWNYLVSLYAEQLQIAEDQAFFGASNASFAAGGLAYLDVGGANTAVTVYRGGASNSTMTKLPYLGETLSATVNPWKDLCRLIDSVPLAYTKGGQIFIDQHCWNAMLGVTNANFSPAVDIMNTMLDKQGSTYYFGGFEVVPLSDATILSTYTAGSAQATTCYAAFGNLQKAKSVLATRQGVEVEMLREGTLDGVSLAASDLQAMRIKERIAIAHGFPSRIGLLFSSTT